MKYNREENLRNIERGETISTLSLNTSQMNSTKKKNSKCQYLTSRKIGFEQAMSTYTSVHVP